MKDGQRRKHHIRHKTHTKESFCDILETLRNIENELCFNPSQVEQVRGSSLALSAEQAKKLKVAPKADKEIQPSKPQESTSNISHLEERRKEMAMFIKSMKKFMKKGYRGDRSDRPQGSGSKDQTDRRKSHQSDDEEDQPDSKVRSRNDYDKSKLLCFYCAKPGHFKADCPQLAKYGDKGDDQKVKRQQRQERKTLVASREAELKNKLKDLKKVKAYIAEHDESSEDESDNDTDELDENALVCVKEDSDEEFEDELCKK